MIELILIMAAIGVALVESIVGWFETKAVLERRQLSGQSARPDPSQDSGSSFLTYRTRAATKPMPYIL